MIFFLLSAPSRYHYSLTTTLSHVAIYYIVVYADRDAVIVGDAVVCFNDGDTGDEAEADDDDDDVGEVFRAIDNTITLQWEGQ